jgi:hypothetical protein
MIRKENPELRTLMLSHLADKYKLLEVRTPNHLSTFTNCITKAYLDQKQASEPTEEELMLFALGYGLQDVLTPKDTVAPYVEKYSIVYRPDFLIPRNSLDRLTELKTTRKSAKNHWLDELLPETWLAYMKGGCYIKDQVEYDLTVLYLMGSYNPPFPTIMADTFIFTDSEIADNWNWIKPRRDELARCLAEDTPPEPYKWCFSWECKFCRNKLVCETIVRLQYPASIRHLEGAE